MKINTGIEKSLKKIIKNVGEARPFLQCAHFENGNIIATDSHQLVRFRDSVPKELNFNLNLTNFTFDDGIYPDTSELIPTKFATEFQINAVEAIDLIPYLKSLPRAAEVSTKMTIQSNKMILETKRGVGSFVGQRLIIEITDFTGKENSICFRSGLLVNALESVKEFKSLGHIKIGIQESEYRPFLIVFKNMDYLITPVRAF